MTPPVLASERSVRRRQWYLLLGAEDADEFGPPPKLAAGPRVAGTAGPRSKRMARIAARLPRRLVCRGLAVTRETCLDCGRLGDRCATTRSHIEDTPEIASPPAAVACVPAPALDAEVRALLAVQMPSGVRYATVAERDRAGVHSARLVYWRKKVYAHAMSSDERQLVRAVEKLKTTLADAGLPSSPPCPEDHHA
jgi:hypothetical protein